MSKVDWSKAPEGAQFYGQGLFWREELGDNFYWCNFHNRFKSSEHWHHPKMAKDYEQRPQQWPDEARIDTIGTNGNDGEHYMKVYQLNGESMHYDEFRQDEQAPSKAGCGKNKYQRDIVGLDGVKTIVDVYRVLDAFKTDSAAIDHAIKKLLAPGLRHSKDRKQDLQEAIDSIAAELLLMEQK